MRRLWPEGGIYRGWWIVATGYIAQMGTVGATGWVFGVLILPMQNDLGWSRSVAGRRRHAGAAAQRRLRRCNWARRSTGTARGC